MTEESPLAHICSCLISYSSSIRMKSFSRQIMENCQPPYGVASKICMNSLTAVSTCRIADCHSDVSRPSQLSANIYLRQFPQYRSSASTNDIFLGGIKVNPV